MGSKNKIIVLAIAIFTAATWIPAAQSKPAANKQETINCGSDTKPCIVKVVPAEDAEKLTEQEQADRRKEANDKKMVILTNRLVWVGGFQFVVFCLQLAAFISQVLFMRKTVNEMQAGTKVTEALAKAARDSATTAEITAERQLRAYVSVDIAHFEFPGNAEDPWYIHVAVKNYGQTPAYSCIVKTEYKISPQENGNPIFSFSINAQNQPEAYIAPRHQHTIRIHCPEMGVNTDRWAEYGRAGYKAYLWGRIDYVDCFKQKRFVTFQMICHFGQVSGFAHCAVGNGAD